MAKTPSESDKVPPFLDKSFTNLFEAPSSFNSGFWVVVILVSSTFHKLSAHKFKRSRQFLKLLKKYTNIGFIERQRSGKLLEFWWTNEDASSNINKFQTSLRESLSKMTAYLVRYSSISCSCATLYTYTYKLWLRQRVKIISIG